MMKKILFSLGAVAVLAMAGPAFAVDDVTNTRHNLSTGQVDSVGDLHAVTGTGAEEICVFCHTPHKGSIAAQPLWNRTITTSGYTMYDSAWSSTIDETVDPTPTGVSAACLSCHDGVTAFNALVNGPGSGTNLTVVANWTFNNGADSMAGEFPALGKDMRDDHPISITYRTADTTGFNPEGSLSYAKIYSGKVQCGSCHNPHEATIPTFLRVANTGSQLCLDCHIK